MSSTGLDIKRKKGPESHRVHPVQVRVIKPVAAPIRAVATAAVVWPAPTVITGRVVPVEPTTTIVTIKSYHPVSYLKTFLIAFAAAISAFGLSIATSEVMARMNSATTPAPVNTTISSQPLADATVRVESPSLPVTADPSTLALSSVIITDPNAIYLPEEKIDAPDPLTQRKAFLTTYLKSKNSPLAAHVDALSEQTQWKLIIAISNSESSYCKRNELNNCWGIGGAWNLKAYDNYDQAIADVNRLLEQKYIAAGLTSPDQIEGKWVGYSDQNWEEAANEVMNDLKNVQ